MGAGCCCTLLRARKTKMLVDGGPFAMHILHPGTKCTFLQMVSSKIPSGVRSLPPSRVLAAARRRAVPICLCLCLRLAPALPAIARHVMIDPPAENGRLGQRRASFAGSTSRCKEEVSCEALEALHEKAPGSATWAGHGEAARERQNPPMRGSETGTSF